MIKSFLADVVGGVSGPISTEVPLRDRILAFCGIVIAIIVIIAVIAFLIKCISSKKSKSSTNKMENLTEEEKKLIENYRKNKDDIDDKNSK